MTNDQLLTIDGRSAVRVERQLDHPVEKVWRAVTQPEHLAQWFPASVTIDQRVGGEIRFDMGDEAGGDDEAGSDAAGRTGDASRGEVLELDPPRLLTFSWGLDRLRFELTPTVGGAGTTFVLTHAFDDRAGAASFATGWGMCLAALAPVIAGEPVPDSGRGIERHEELVKTFGLDAGDVTEDHGRWTVQFERQLTCPAEVAWDLFFGIDQQTGEQRQAPGVGEPLTPYAAPEVVLGTVTEVDAPRTLAFDVAAGEPGDHVRFELTTGTGHGARLLLTVTGSTDRPAERDAAYEQWGQGAVEHIAAEAASWALTSALA